MEKPIYTNIFDKIDYERFNRNEDLIKFYNLDNPNIKKIGLLYTGNINTFQKNKKIHENLIKNLKKTYQLDVIGFYKENDRYLFSIDDFNFDYTYQVESKFPFRINKKFNEFLEYPMKKSIKQLYNYYNVYQKLILHQKKNNCYYDILINLDYSSKLLIDYITFEGLKDEIYTSSGNKLLGNIYQNKFINLNFVLGKQYLMKCFYNSICHVNEFKQVFINNVILKVLENYNIKNNIIYNLPINENKFTINDNIYIHDVIRVKCSKKTLNFRIHFTIIFLDYYFYINNIDNDIYQNHYIINTKLNENDIYKNIDYYLSEILYYIMIKFNFKKLVFIFDKNTDMNQLITFKNRVSKLNHENQLLDKEIIIKNKYVKNKLIYNNEYSLTDYIKFNSNNEYVENCLKLKNYKTEKIAILYCGNIRQYTPEKHKIFINFLEKKYNCKVDCFYQIFKNDQFYSIFIEKYKEYFVHGVELENDNLPFIVNEKSNDNLYCSAYQNCSQLYSYYKVFESFVEYQKTNNIFYEYVFRIRYDFEALNYENMSLDENILYIANNCIFKDNFKKISFDDRFGYSSQNIMWCYFNAFCHLNDCNLIHAETFLNTVINNYNINYIVSDIKIQSLDNNNIISYINIYIVFSLEFINLYFNELNRLIIIIDIKRNNIKMFNSEGIYGTIWNCLCEIINKNKNIKLDIILLNITKIIDEYNKKTYKYFLHVNNYTLYEDIKYLQENSNININFINQFDYQNKNYKLLEYIHSFN